MLADATYNLLLQKQDMISYIEPICDHETQFDTASFDHYLDPKHDENNLTNQHPPPLFRIL
jgi:hypothetical protein